MANPPAAPDTPALDNPYPGLRPFQADETHLFFGRDAQRTELLRRLRMSRFLAVVGTSGSGKSSLVRAGLLPGLHGGFMAGRNGCWRVADMRPGTDPIGNLARALDAPGVLRDTALAEGEPSFTAVTLRRSSLGLVQALREAQLPDGDSLLVLVDQFEELFRAIEALDKVQAADDASAFVKLLLEAVNQPALNVYVVLTMRSDFLGDCARFRDLPEAINSGQYLIPRMTRDQIREAITGPAAVQGVALSAPLVNRLLNDVGESPDQLPILQHALMRTWRQWSARADPGSEITLDDYEATGGMGEALKRHADEVLASLAVGVDATTAARRQHIAERLFKALSGIGGNGRRVRRLARLADVADVADATADDVLDVAAAFRQPDNAFLMPPAGEAVDADTYLDISHESLIRHWQQLGDWLRHEADAANQYLRVTDIAQRHAEQRADLWAGPELAEALHWRSAHQPNAAWARRYQGDFVQAMDFLDGSHGQERSNESRLQRNRRVRVSIAAVLLSVLLGAALMWLGNDISRARMQAQRAETLKSDLQMNEPLIVLMRQRREGLVPAELGQCLGVTPPAPAAGTASASGDAALGTPAADEPVPPLYSERQLPLLRRLCDPNRAPSTDDQHYLDIVDLIEKGDAPEAARRITEQAGRIVIDANNLLFELADMKSGELRDERRKLLELKATVEGAEPATLARRRSVVSLARVNGQPQFLHPVHQRIAERLTTGDPLAPGEDWLLATYKAQSRSKWQADVGDPKFAECRSPEIDLFDRPAERLAQEFYKAMCDAALRPDSQLVQVYASTKRLATEYAWDLMILLSWPAWRLRRWQQRRLRQPIDARPHPLRRALANLMDGMVAFGAMWVVVLLGEALASMLSTVSDAASDVAQVVAAVLMALVPLGYVLLADRLHFKHHRSVGKIVFDLRPLRDAGGELGVVDCVRRNTLLAVGVFVVALLLGLWSPDDADLVSNGLAYGALMAVLVLPNMLLRGRSWADRWSNTHVVDADSEESLATDRPARYCKEAAGKAVAVAVAVRTAPGG